MKKYSLVSLLSILIRTFVLSRFFDSTGLGLVVDLVVPGVTIFMVGIIYSSGENPPLGSFMFLLMYVLNYTLGNILIITWFNFFTIITIALYLFAIGIYYFIFDKILRN